VSTFLTLCQDLRRECLIPGTGPTTVVGQTGQAERLVKWVRDAYTELQNEQANWRWLRGNFQLLTVSGTRYYPYTDVGVTDSDSAAAITRWSRWWTENPFIYLQSAGVGTRHSLGWVDWQDLREVFNAGTETSAYPIEWSIDPQERIAFRPAPDGVYVFQGEYQKGPQTLALDADTPEMPARHHALIVAMAMKKYAAAMAAPEVYAQARDIEAQHRAALEISQLPAPRFGPPLC
jgi:hypothetical protein